MTNARYPRIMPGWFSPWELLLVLAIILLLFGPKRLPQLGRSLGRGAREFTDSIRGRHDKDDEAEPAELPPPAPEREKVS
jgi:sec-independent protein translocase protein TatA